MRHPTLVLRLLAAPLLALPAAAAFGGALPSGVGLYLWTAAGKFAHVGDGTYSYASGPGLSVYNGGGFIDEGGSGFVNNSINPAPATFALGMTTASLQQTSTSAYGPTVARAAASLEQGTLRATANSYTGPTNQGEVMFSFAQMRDMITFHVAGGGAAEVQVLTHVDGTVSANGVSSAVSSLTSYLRLGDGGYQYSASGYIDGQHAPPSIVLSGFTGGIVRDPTFTNANYTGYDFSGHTTVTDGLVLPLDIWLQVRADSGMTADFGNTARFSLGLPAGVTMTSASGVLLTAAVPEPQSWALMLAGLAAVGWLARRRG